MYRPIETRVLSAKIRPGIHFVTGAGRFQEGGIIQETTLAATFREHLLWD